MQLIYWQISSKFGFGVNKCIWYTLKSNFELIALFQQEIIHESQYFTQFSFITGIILEPALRTIIDIN